MRTREEWLDVAVSRLAPLVPGVTPAVHVSVGFPRGARGKRRRAVGQCWNGSLSADGTAHLFVCPTLGDAPEVAHVLLHELIHATVGTEAGHKGAFVQAAKAVGLVRPWTATTPGPELKAQLDAILAELPAYPHAALSLADRPKAGSRLRLWECECERPVKVRVASDEFAATCDRCGEPFKQSKLASVCREGDR